VYSSKTLKKENNSLMRRMGIEALYQRLRTATPHPGHKAFPYLLLLIGAIEPFRDRRNEATW
jgi:hypothetical protein